MSLPIGDRVPRRGNALSRGIGRLFLALLGWRLEGGIANLPKMVLIGAPHTTNWDGVLSLAALTALGLRSGTMIKDSAFKGPLGRLLRWFGAIPIQRGAAGGVVEQSIDAFAAHSELLLLIAPEGTRYAAADWKRGFHRIAAGAKVPILPAAIDYGRKCIHFGPVLVAGSDYEADLATLLRFYGRHSEARHPRRTSKPVCKALGRSWQASVKAEP
jgi:1-acyl-sn-glycerol-3-phosphate acyltransferase